MMQYISTDLETTGLDPQQDQILEIAAVVDGGIYSHYDHVEDLPTFQARIKWDRLAGNPVALVMNAKLIEEITLDANAMTMAEAAIAFEQFLRKFADAYKQPKPKVTGAGKNFASFDLQFLKVGTPHAARLFHHRCIDPAMYFVTGDDREMPDTDTCLARAGFETTNRVRHNALEDARNVVRLVRAGVARLPTHAFNAA